MKQNIQRDRDRLIIDAFHEAWRFKQARLGERSRGEGADFGRMVEVERERLRNEILREKNVQGLAGWFLRFCADATRGGSLPALQKNGPEIRTMLFSSPGFHHFEWLQNLFLFALLSYSRTDTDTADQELESTEGE